MDIAAAEVVSQAPMQHIGGEERLLERIAKGDREAFTELYDRYHLLLFRYLLQLTPDHGLAEELLQDTLVAVWKSAHTFQGRSRVPTWLFGVARRQAHNSLRRRDIPLADAESLDTLPAADLVPEASLLATAQQEDLLAAIQRLAPVLREVLHRIFVQELSYQESATVLGVPVGTVKSRLNHARQALRAALRDEKESER